ncbi:hypothetical protein LTR37_018990 [Vermiconidia calcicola]|uniref:Uncharacterized protein n=1 Tax=Vermiconidia calcicola TaxID=1690605 RepID=A0ACC3MGY4_9PEZI|nr:hypothetical protein LTR37_018990 [Vermiconidia calcicola]
MDLKDDQPQYPKQNTPRSHSLRNLVLALGLIAVATYWAVGSFSHPGGVLHGVRIWSRSYINMRLGSASSREKALASDECDLHDPNEDPLPAVRTVFGGKGTIVYGWPSTGGIWVHEDCYGVELHFLSLSRFEPSEDGFCKRLEMIGAHFYESEYAFNIQTFTYNASRVWYGWPGDAPKGGVWVLRTKGPEGAELGVSRIRNALTMEERCKAIEMLGGKFYKRWDDIE